MALTWHRNWIQINLVATTHLNNQTWSSILKSTISYRGKLFPIWFCKTFSLYTLHILVEMWILKSIGTESLAEYVKVRPFYRFQSYIPRTWHLKIYFVTTRSRQISRRKFRINLIKVTMGVCLQTKILVLRILRGRWITSVQQSLTMLNRVKQIQ